MKKKNYTVLLAALACAAGAHAEGYVTVARGQSRASSSVDCSGTTHCDNNPSGMKLMGGYDYGNGFSLEGGYVSFGKFRTDTTTSSATGKPSALVVSGVMGVPLGDSWRANIKLGVAQVRFKGTYEDSTLYTSSSESRLKYFAGLGLSYAVTKSVKVELAADMTQVEYNGARTSVQLFSLGTTIAF